MKHLFFTSSLFCLFLAACNNGGKTDDAAAQAAADSTAVANTIHGFYQWYDGFIKDPKNDGSYVVVADGHYVLDMNGLNNRYAAFKSSGFVGAELIESGIAYYKSCEKAWAAQSAEDGLEGMDADMYFCAQDWDINNWTKAPVKIKSLGTDKMAATMAVTEGGTTTDHHFELKKEGEKWVLTKVECDMGAVAAPSEQETVEDLAAFYTGNVPCKDCDGIETLLTLNADPQRSFTLEEEYKGKKTKKVETKGTWAVADGVVTLTSKSGSSSYVVTKEGLISANPDGTKRDEKTASKYLLKKVQGE